MPTSKSTLAAYSIHCTWAGSVHKCCTKSHQGVDRKRRVTCIKDLGEMVVLVESWDGIHRQWSY